MVPLTSLSLNYYQIGVRLLFSDQYNTINDIIFIYYTTSITTHYGR